MANIKWTAAGGWEGGVEPGIDDVAVFDATSDDFTATQADSWGGISFYRYTAAFTRGAFDLTLGSQGFITTDVPGTVSLGSSTVTNSGSVDFSGIDKTNFIITQATWIQQGGTKTSPNTWTDLNANRRNFTKIHYAEGDHTEFTRANTTLQTVLIQVDGTLVLPGVLRIAATTSTLNIGASGRVIGNVLRIFSANLTGNVENIKVDLLEFQDSFTAPGGRYTVPVFCWSQLKYSVTGTFATDAIFEKNVTLDNLDSGGFTVNWANVTFLADFITKKTGTGNISVIGEILLAGTADQNIDLGAFDGSIPMVVQKTAGIVTLSGEIDIVFDSICGKIVNYGSIYVADGVTLEADIETKSGSSLIFAETAVLITENITRPSDHSDVIDVANTTIPGTQTITMDMTGNQADLWKVVFDRPDPSGLVTLTASGNTCLSGRQNGDIKLLGTGDYGVCTGLTLESGRIDTSELAGTWNPGSGTVIERPLYRDHFYTAKLYAQSNPVNFSGEITEIGVVQDASRV